MEMDRFRPNVVVTGCNAHEEDFWSRVTIGGIPMTGVKPCPRCVATTVDPETGVRGSEPLATLETAPPPVGPTDVVAETHRSREE
jgi:uncharacterized protein YcbX